jgi:hypothetical protein
MSQHPSPPTRRMLTDTELVTVITAIAEADSSASVIAVAVTETFNALLAPLGQSLADYDAARPFDPTAFAIPASQWAAITEACLARADAFGGRVHVALDLVNLMPSTYEDASVKVSVPPPPDQRPPEYVLTVTREATDVITAASARCTDLARCYGPRSREHVEAVMSWQAQLSRLFSMSLGSTARVSRDDDLSLLVTTGTGFTYGIIFHPARRRCLRAGCTATLSDDGTPTTPGPACLDGRHHPSFPLGGVQPGTWSFHS